MKPLAVLLLLLTTVAACRSEPEPDAYGNVEATEVVVSAKASGQLTEFRPQDGDRLAAGEIVGRVEVTQLTHEADQVRAQRAASVARLAEIDEQIDALRVQQQTARRAYERARRLVEQRAGTAQQLDQTEGEYRVLGEQIEAARARRESIRLESGAADARVAQIEERVSEAEIVNPIAGTVLASYARTGELTQPGQPLYRIANMEAMEIRAYITETQLAAVKVGQRADVSVDAGKDERHVVSGTVTWVSPDAEFTPTPIQTREERADLVYAVKISVPNPGGILKIGMPAEVDFVAAP
ncbi:MAG TPA: HlyD family efflux transporter periplasmic adaptor subunit [Thermoanaerobaculia bacterium]|nr:HlyD family efflux transporter periplasmic adaptor subunit [Thermoanaerobaculia bacterium]